MVTFGIDAHKRTHTVVAVDDVGCQLGVRTTTGTGSEEPFVVDPLGRAVRR